MSPLLYLGVKSKMKDGDEVKVSSLTISHKVTACCWDVWLYVSRTKSFPIRSRHSRSGFKARINRWPWKANINLHRYQKDRTYINLKKGIVVAVGGISVPMYKQMPFLLLCDEFDSWIDFFLTPNSVTEHVLNSKIATVAFLSDDACGLNTDTRILQIENE